jgi:hypothetical protein
VAEWLLENLSPWEPSGAAPGAGGGPSR